MIARQMRNIAVASLLAVAAIGLWNGLEMTASVDPSVGPGAARPTQSTGAQVGLDTLDPPDDLDDALAAAQSFAVSLYRSDVPALRRQATPELADTLLAPSRVDHAPSGRVHVEGTVTRDAQPGRVLVDVIVRRGPVSDEHLETVTVLVVRDDGGWLIDDTAF